MFHPTPYPGTLEENYETVLLQLGNVLNNG